MNEQDEGWVNEVGSYLSKDVGRILLFPFLLLLKVIRKFGNWVSVPKHAARFMEGLTISTIYLWWLSSSLIPNINKDFFTFIITIVSFAVFLTALIVIPLFFFLVENDRR